MGSSQSTNTTNISENVLSEVATNMLATQQINSGGSQMIDVVGGNGSVDISNNTQTIKSTLNLTGLSKMMATQKAQQDIVTKLAQAASASTSGINLGNSSNANNNINMVMDATMKMSTTLGQICSTNSMSSQIIEVKNNNGNVAITNNTQSQVKDAIANCVMNTTSSQESLQRATTAISQTATATTVGFDLWSLIIFILVLALVPAIVLGVPLVMGASVVENSIMKFLGPIMFIGGIALICYWKYVVCVGLKTYIKGTQFSTLIANDPTCGAVQLEIPFSQPQTPPSSQTPSDSTISPLSLATAMCLQTQECAGLDWDVKKSRITFYKNMSNLTSDDQCPGVKQQDTTSMDLIHNAELYLRSNVDPTIVDSVDPVTLAKFHDNTQFLKSDVVLDTVTGAAYWKISPNVEPQWTEVGVIPGWTQGCNIVAKIGAPDDSVGKNGDIWIDKQPLVWTGYIKASKTYNATQGGTVWTPSYATEQTLTFPGRIANILPPQTYNWSGVKVQQVASPMYLYIGLAFILFGIFITIGGFIWNPSRLAESPQSNSVETTVETPTPTATVTDSNGQ
jgi:hypothetical protein